MSYRTWIEAKKFGDIYENKAIEMLGVEVIRSPNKYFPEWDFKTMDDIKYEVKADKIAYKTGNMCIEYEHKDKNKNIKPSGIKLSKAQYYIYYVVSPTEEIVYNIPIDKLRKHCEGVRSIWCGSNYASHCYLIPLSNLSEFKTITINNNN